MGSNRCGKALAKDARRVGKTTVIARYPVVDAEALRRETRPSLLRDWLQQREKDDFSRRLRREMGRSGLDASALSATSGVPKRYIHDYLGAKKLPKFQTAEKLAKSLGCTASDLLFK